MLVSGRGSQNVQQVWASFNDLPSFRSISVSRTLEEGSKKLPPPVTQPKGSVNFSSLTQLRVVS
jgi:hypothetical protein